MNANVRRLSGAQEHLPANISAENAGLQVDANDAGAISTLIGLIYDSALDPKRWPAALAATSAFLPGYCAALISKDAVSESGNIYYDDGTMDPQYKRLYFEKYVKIDPFNSAHVFAAIGETASLADWMPFEELEQSRIYREWMQPQRIVDYACAVLDKTATGAALFGVLRQEHHGFVDDEACARMQMIVPHVRRAVLIGRAIELKTTEAATLADTLDGVAAGMLLLDTKGNVTHANAAGRAMLAEGDVLREKSGRVVAYDTRANQALADILASSGSDAALGIRGISLPITGRSDERYVAHVLPLTSGARRRAGADHAAVAAVFVRKATLDTRSPLEVVAKAYRLTPSELRVLLAVADGGGVAEVADMLGIAETTVKFHLRSLFVKTGTRRQAELVKLLASHANVLAN
jgi:DNA-binding CsgD family transcriptional regulator